MIAVDTSALWAIVMNESGHERVLEFLLSRHDLVMSAATLVEFEILCMRRLPSDTERSARELLQVLDIRIEPFTANHATIAREGMLQYGRGSGSPAKLNLGDAYSYALSRALRCPLLFVGEDFADTDVEPAFTP